MTPITIPARFRGPPQSGNGGYVAGLLARLAGGHRAVAMRAPAPLDTDLTFDGSGETARLTHGDTLIAEAAPADVADLPVPPAPPTLEQARAASEGYQSFHPICVCCTDRLPPEEGLRVRAGQVEVAPAGTVAAVWDVHPAFCDADGRAPEEIVWAAMDCPGFYAWVAHDGRHGALTGRMQAEVLERPRAGEACIVLAWPLERVSERRRTAGVALFGADGRLMARGVQTWIAVARREG
jgi:hypothetical protein